MLRKSGWQRVLGREFSEFEYGSGLGKASGNLTKAEQWTDHVTSRCRNKLAEMKSPIIIRWERNYKGERMITIILQRFWED
jgi:hypothetical protein